MMFKRTAAVLTILLFFVPVLALAQQATLCGKVKLDDDIVLPGVKVWLENTLISTITDKDGTFTLANISPGKYFICASLDGFITEKISVFVPQGKTIVVDFSLNIKKIAEEASVTAERPLLSAAEKVSKITLTPRQIANLPSMGEKDIFRAFQLLPGISGSNEASSGLYVRGGTPDQNLILYDGFTIYHVDHLFGYFSAFNMEAVEQVDLHKGGFESKYGGRLSSVMELTGKSGSKEQIGFGAGLSMLSINGSAEIPLFDIGSLLIAGRRSFQSPLYNSIADMFSASTGKAAGPGQARGGSRGGGGGMFESQPSSYFYDVNAKMNLDLSERDNFVLSFYNGKDDLDNSRTMTTPPFLEERGVSFEGDVTDLTEWGNTGFSAGWDRFWSDAYHSRLVLALSNYFNNRDQINNTSITFPEQEDDDFSFPGRGKSFARGSVENNDLNDLTVRWDNTLSLGGHEIGLGFQLTSNTITYNFEEDETVDEDEDAEETPQRQLIGVLNRKDEGTAYAFYLQDRWTLFDRLTLTPGFRGTYFDQTEKWYYEPRFSLHMDLSSRFKLKGAWGRYYQIVTRITREDLLRGNREFWALADGEQIPVSSAVHAVGGLSYETDDLLFDMEAYFKSLGGLSEFAPRIFTSEDIDYNQFFYQGDGTARGIEFLLQKKTGSLNGWLSYTLAEVEYNFPDLEDEPFPALQDQTHEFKLVGLYEIGDWTFSSTWIYATGKPYTEPVGIEEVEIFNGRIRELVIAGDKNGGRLPAYHRMDLSANYSFSFGDTDKSYLGLTIFNLYDRKNVWYKEFDVLEGEIIESNFNLMGLTFNLFLNVKF